MYHMRYSENDNSVVVKFLDEKDVFPWVEPVMKCIDKKK